MISETISFELRACLGCWTSPGLALATRGNPLGERTPLPASRNKLGRSCAGTEDRARGRSCSLSSRREGVFQRSQWRAETRARGMVYVPVASLSPLKKLEHPARFCYGVSATCRRITSWGSINLFCERNTESI